MVHKQIDGNLIAKFRILTFDRINATDPMNTVKQFLLSLLIGMVGLQSAHTQTQIGSDILGEADYDFSGASVSMPDEYTVAIGAPHNSTSLGHVRIYSWDGVAWTQKGLDIDILFGGFPGSGHSVSMPDSNTVAVGSPANILGGQHDGYVSVFSWDGSTWIQKGITINGNNDDELGTSVSMPDSNTFAVGAPGTGLSAGFARVYSWNGSSWIQKGLDLNGEAVSDKYGNTVCMPDDSTIAVGGHGNDGNGGVSGHVRVFRWNGTAWAQKGADIDGEEFGDWSGFSLSMPDGDHVAIGSTERYSTVPNHGNVRIFWWDGNNWIQKGPTINGEDDDDWFGYSVSMPDNNTVGIGAPHNSDNRGHVRKYQWDGIAWDQVGLDIDGWGPDLLGWSVSMPTPNTVAVGAPGGGVNKGYAQVFSIDSTAAVENNAIDLLKIYPNPTSGEIYITIGNDAITHVEIFNIAGELLFSRSIKGTTKFNLENLAPGIYFMRFHQTNILLSNKMVVVK